MNEQNYLTRIRKLENRRSLGGPDIKEIIDIIEKSPSYALTYLKYLLNNLIIQLSFSNILYLNFSNKYPFLSQKSTKNPKPTQKLTTSIPILSKYLNNQTTDIQIENDGKFDNKRLDKNILHRLADVLRQKREIHNLQRFYQDIFKNQLMQKQQKDKNTTYDQKIQTPKSKSSQNKVQQSHSNDKKQTTIILNTFNIMYPQVQCLQNEIRNLHCMKQYLDEMEKYQLFNTSSINKTQRLQQNKLVILEKKKIQMLTNYDSYCDRSKENRQVNNQDEKFIQSMLKSQIDSCQQNLQKMINNQNDKLKPSWKEFYEIFFQKVRYYQSKLLRQEWANIFNKGQLDNKRMKNDRKVQLQCNES